MIPKKKWLLITFYTTAAAMKTEKLCAKAGSPGKLVPVPRSITSDCGIAWRAELTEKERLTELLKEVETAGFHEAEM